MASYIRGANPIWYMVDQTGEPLNDNYYAFFLTNTLPYLPQTVYQDPLGTIPYSNPIQFNPNGTLPNNLYFNNDLVYRIEIRRGPTQFDPLIGNPIENYSPGIGTGGSSATYLLTAPNLLTNPQFADIYFSNPYTYTKGVSSTYTFPIGPGWNLIFTGAGTTIITQTSLPGNSDIESNPTYYLTIQNSGWTTVTLRQTFSNNGALFSGGAIAVSFLAFATGSAQSLAINYVDSDGNSVSLFPSTSIQTGTLSFYKNAVTMPNSSNTDSGTNAFVNINYILPPAGTLSLANLQLTGQSTELPGDFDNSSIQPFEELTYERIVDQQFHVYKNSIVIQPKDSILTGWSFALNPFQFITTSITTKTAQTSYICDQTILYQTAGSQLQTGSAAPIERFVLQVQPVVSATATRFALITYLDPSTILPHWSSYVSALAKIGFVSSAIPATTVRFKMRLIVSQSLPSTISNTEPIASWASNSDPTFSGSWTAIAPENDPIYTLPNGNYNFYAFNKFLLPPNTSGGETQTLGVVFYTMDDMSSVNPVDYLLVDRISLVPNDFAIDSNPETFDQVLRQCQYYYEKSYDYFTLPGTAITAGSLIQSQQVIGDSTGNVTYMNASNLAIPFKQVKRAAPTMKVYNLAGTANSIGWEFFSNGVLTQSANVTFTSAWSSFGISTTNATYNGIRTTSFLSPSPPFGGVDYGFAVLHYTANACLGNPTLA